MSTTDPGVGAGADDELLAALRSAVARVDPPPSDLRDANRALHSWRDPDAELAALVADSRALASSVRGPGDAILLRFRGDARTITVELTRSGPDRTEVVGRVEPGRAGQVSIRRPGSEIVVDCDDLGRFGAEDLGRGPVSFRWTSASTDDPPIETPWLLV